MISTPNALLGLGGIDVRGAFGPFLRGAFADSFATPVNAPIGGGDGTALPSGGTAVRLRPVTWQLIEHVVVTKNLFENTGTTLGNLSPGRPQS
ncbi:MAG: hypothetical protein JWR82_1995 [Blastococcus sp.]|nr:hypothetical protein [Blastococcus sp.]